MSASVPDYDHDARVMTAQLFAIVAVIIALIIIIIA
jgi:hypothetical protein